MLRLNSKQADLERAAELLAAGCLVAFPTETVYGLGANARDPAAVSRVFEAKGRPSDHPLIVHLACRDEIDRWADPVPPLARTLAEAFWPGPLTLVLHRAPRVPTQITGGQDTVALRVPAHEVALRLLSIFGDGLVAPSANRFGRVSPTCAQHVIEELGERIDAVVDGGPCSVGVESTILDLSGDEIRILRPGMLDNQRLAQVLGQVPHVADRNEGPRSPGRLSAHYAPRIALELLPREQLLDRFADLGGRAAVLAFGDRPASAATAEESPGPDANRWRPMPDDAESYARALYARLRELDDSAFAAILVERPPEEPAWAAILDRLSRAAAGREVYDG
jgi:L-threonylcarbamoyladenylate synthase